MRRTSRSDRDTLAKVRTEIRQLEVRAAQFERASSPGIVALRRLIEKYHLTPEDIRLALNGPARKRGVAPGTKLPPKYRNPDDPSQSSAGRGLRPNWLDQILRNGARLEEFEVDRRQQVAFPRRKPVKFFSIMFFNVRDRIMSG